MVTKATTFDLTSEYYSLSVMSAKLYFLEIGPAHQKLWPFKVTWDSFIIHKLEYY